MHSDKIPLASHNRCIPLSEMEDNFGSVWQSSALLAKEVPGSAKQVGHTRLSAAVVLLFTIMLQIRSVCVCKVWFADAHQRKGSSVFSSKS